MSAAVRPEMRRCNGRRFHVVEFRRILGSLRSVGPHGAGSAAEQLRTAEVIGTLCLATDLGMGFPFEHGLHTTVIAMRLADRLGVDRQTAVQTYYGSLLSHAGCTTDAHLADRKSTRLNSSHVRISYAVFCL